MVKKPSIEIPKEDLEDINKSFENNKAGVIVKNALGEPLKVERKAVNDGPNYAFVDFRGRTLRHNKSVVPVSGKQFTAGIKGQKFDDIPEELRNQVAWLESDFE